MADHDIRLLTVWETLMGGGSSIPSFLRRRVEGIALHATSPAGLAWGLPPVVRACATWGVPSVEWVVIGRDRIDASWRYGPDNVPVDDPVEYALGTVTAAQLDSSEPSLKVPHPLCSHPSRAPDTWAIAHAIAWQTVDTRVVPRHSGLNVPPRQRVG